MSWYETENEVTKMRDIISNEKEPIDRVKVMNHLARVSDNYRRNEESKNRAETELQYIREEKANYTRHLESRIETRGVQNGFLLFITLVQSVVLAILITVKTLGSP